MGETEDVLAFLTATCRCHGDPKDFVQSSDLVKALIAWRADRGLPTWTPRLAACYLRDVVPEWRDPETGIRPHRMKSSTMRYIGLRLTVAA